jgi:RNA polymerase sigma-70 factor (ECF subfamily)
MPDEEDLWIEQARRGDVESFSRVVLLRQGYIRAFLGRFSGHPDVVDDLAQETFLRAFTNLDSFDGRAPFLAWVAGIARNLALEHLRKESRRLARQNARLADAMAAWRAQGPESESTTPEGHERYVRAIQGCLGGLPPKSAEAIDRHYFRGEPAVNLARRLKTSANAVHQLLFRVRQALRRCVEKRLAEESR